ncbi:MAG: 6-bladed beta-propeller [Bacteroidetes bacterium]|nr:6-bladed beta-propeller [Bacteroidota bacterium]
MISPFGMIVSRVNFYQRILILFAVIPLYAPIELTAQSDGLGVPATLTELWRLGEEDNQNILFGDIQSVQIDSQGQLYVYDHPWGNSGIIYKISPGGNLLHQIGSEGSGPGEFELISGIYVGMGDTVYAMDNSHERIYKYAPPEHEFFDMRRIQRVEDSFSDPWRLVGANTMGFIVGYMTPFMNWIPETMTSENNYDVYLINQGGIRADSIILREPDIERIIYDGGTGYTHMIFSHSPVVFVGKTGKIYSGSGKESEIRIMTVNGEIERTLSLDIEAIPVTRQDIEKSLENADEMRRRLTYASDIPENKPYYQHFTVDDLGHTWVQLNERYGATEVNWLIIDQNNDVVNNFMLPSNIRLLSVDRGKAYGVKDDIILIAYKIN